ncbi:hypothetical protein [Sphingomonas lenta]|uniref:Uncharacterized protein n=1 Tax=Sphingomonas lenta TaxID=1141887 RepID=A0A2A2SDP2_9SPHN|nr:hypothetical protein [Sphingomonas lenta]PAX07333.1 hypothetical protein CKY28_15065 [Sphingomonas lenta]
MSTVSGTSGSTSVWQTLVNAYNAKKAEEDKKKEPTPPAPPPSNEPAPQPQPQPSGGPSGSEPPTSPPAEPTTGPTAPSEPSPLQQLVTGVGTATESVIRNRAVQRAAASVVGEVRDYFDPVFAARGQAAVRAGSTADDGTATRVPSVEAKTEEVRAEAATAKRPTAAEIVAGSAYVQAAMSAGQQGQLSLLKA